MSSRGLTVLVARGRLDGMSLTQPKLPPAKRTRGRPSKFTREIADEVCRRLREGESLLSICRDDHMPVDACVRKWAAENYNNFYSDYARARDLGLEHRADWLIAHVMTGEDVARDRLVFDANRWYLSKLAPKKYGDKLATELSGPGGGAIEIDHNVVDASALSPEARDALRDILISAKERGDAE